MADNLYAERFVLRPLAPSDIHKGFMQLLGQLTIAGDVSEVQFAERVQYLQRLGDDHHVAVIEDMETSQIVATGSILIEHKFVRNCGKVGHIEDVVVDQSVRGQHLGQRIIEFLTKFAKDKSCYKVILDCTVQNASFYERCGYMRKEIQMARRENPSRNVAMACKRMVRIDVEPSTDIEMDTSLVGMDTDSWRDNLKKIYTQNGHFSR